MVRSGLLIEQALVVSDLGVEDLEVALQVGDVPLDGVAVAGEQVEPVSDAGAAFATELGESLQSAMDMPVARKRMRNASQSRSVVAY